MSSSELNPQGLRAYALYFVVHFAQVFIPALLLQLLSGERVIGSLGMALSWGWALYRLTVRFFRGQGRSPSAAEGRQLALYAALYSAILVTVVRGVAVLVLTYNSSTTSEVPLALLLAIEFMVTMLVNFLTLAVYLLPFVQERAFAAWRERNP